MSFGYSVGDFLLLTQLAYRTVQNARKACGAHDDLAREVSSLHIVLQRVEVEVSKPESILNKTEDNRRRELARLARHCERVLKVLEQILDKYNALPDEKRSVTKLFQKVKFGNGEMLDLGNIRSELATHTQALNMFFNLLSIGSQGTVEKYMDSHGEELREIKHSLHWVTASMQARSHEEMSVLTTYGEDDKAIWKAFRRELLEEGFSSQVLDKHRRTIKKYVMELGERGALDEPIHHTNEDIGRCSTPLLAGHPTPTLCQASGCDSVDLTGIDVKDMGSNYLIDEADHESLGKSDQLIPTGTNSKLRVDNELLSQDQEDRRIRRNFPVLPKRVLGTVVAIPSIQTKCDLDFEASSHEESLLHSQFSKLVSSQGLKGQITSHEANHLLDASSDEGGASLPQDHQLSQSSPKFPRSKLHATVEDVEDEDFVTGVHPNCAISSEEDVTPGVFNLESKGILGSTPQKTDLNTDDIQLSRTSSKDGKIPHEVEFEPVIGPRKTTFIDDSQSDTNAYAEKDYEDGYTDHATSSDDSIMAVRHRKAVLMDENQRYTDWDGGNSSHSEISTSSGDLTSSINSAMAVHDFDGKEEAVEHKASTLRHISRSRNSTESNNPYVDKQSIMQHKSYLVRQRLRREAYWNAHFDKILPWTIPMEETYNADFDFDTITWRDGIPDQSPWLLEDEYENSKPNLLLWLPFPPERYGAAMALQQDSRYVECPDSSQMNTGNARNLRGCI
jgi:hypothetical protein